MNKLDSIAQGLLKPINPYATVILGLLTATWGLWLLLPHPTFASAPLFSKMSDLAPEWAWGSWAYLCGLLIIFSVIMERYRALSFAMGFAVWHWGAVSGMMWWADWQNTGPITYTFICIYSAYIYLNIRVNCVKFGENRPKFF